MKHRWREAVAVATIVALLLLALYQYDTTRRLRTQARLYDAKVANAFQYTANHMDLTSLQNALEALAASPNNETLQRAEQAAQQYTNLLLQLNDLRGSGPPLAKAGLQSDYLYHPSSQEAADLQAQVLKARLWPSLYGVGVLLQRENWQLRPEDKQFLADATAMVKKVNGTLAAMNRALEGLPNQADVIAAAGQQFGLIGPDLEALSTRIEAHKATWPAQ